jgi:hypothetical protein
MLDYFGLDWKLLSKFHLDKYYGKKYMSSEERGLGVLWTEGFKWYCKKRKHEWKSEREGGEMSIGDYKRIHKDEWEAEEKRWGAKVEGESKIGEEMSEEYWEEQKAKWKRESEETFEVNGIGDYEPRTKEEFKRDVVSGMSFGTEDIYEIKHKREYTLLEFIGKCPLAFKPGVGDRLLFRKIVSGDLLDNMHEEEEIENESGSNNLIMGLNVLSSYYYPYYGS